MDSERRISQGAKPDRRSTAKVAQVIQLRYIKLIVLKFGSVSAILVGIHRRSWIGVYNLYGLISFNPLILAKSFSLAVIKM
jgi:hypothetical protein